MIKKSIQKIIDNADKFKLLAPNTVLIRTRYLFLFEEESGNQIIIVMSNITNEVELSVKDPNDKTFNRLRFDLSKEENNLLCFTFEKILCQKRLEFRQNSKEDLDKTKEERQQGIDEHILEMNKSLQELAEEFLNKIDFNKEKK